MVFRTDEGDPIFRPTAGVDEPEDTITPTSTPTSGRTSSGYVAYRESERYEQDVAEGKISGVSPPESDPEPLISDAIKTVEPSGSTPSGAVTPDPALVNYLTGSNAPSLYDSGIIDPTVPAGIPPATYKAIQEGLEKTRDATPFVQTSNLSYGSGTPGQVTYAPPPKEKIEEPLNWYEKLEPERGIDPSPYAQKYGYFPDDPDYDIIRDDLSSKIGSISENISQVHSNIDLSSSYIDQINLDIAMVKSQQGKEWNLTGEGYDPEILYSSDELLNILEGKKEEYLTSRSEAEAYLGDIPEWEQQRIDLKEFKKDIDVYEKLGYEVDILEDDSIQVGLPPPTEVHDWYVGEGDVLGAKGSDVLLGATSFFESPLAIRTATDILSETAFQTMKDDPSIWGAMSLASNLMFSGGQLIGKTVTDWATGSRDIVPEHTKERLSEFSLDLSKSLKEGGGLAFGGKVLTSPAMIEGVYIPLATMGTGYLVTGLGGKTVTTGSSTLANFGKTTGGKITRTAIIGTGLVVGGVGITALGSGLYEMAQTQPEALPGALAEVGFTFGMAYGGYKTGEAMWKSKHTGSWKYDWRSDKAKWDPYEIPQPKDVKFIQPDVMVGELNQDAIFSGRSGAMIGDKPVDVFFKGVAHKSKTDPRFAMAEGEGWVTSKTTKTLWGKQIGENIISHRFKFESPSVIIGQKGQESIYFNVAESQLVAGQPGSYGYGIFKPTHSKGLTWTHEVGDLELFRPTVETGVQLIPDEMGGVKTQPFTMLDADIIAMKQYNFLHSGKYTSGNIYGNIKGMGRMFTYDLKGGGTHGFGGGAVAEGSALSGGEGGLLSKVDMGGVLDVVGGKLSSVGDLGTASAESGGASGSAGVTMASGVGSQILHSPFQSLGTQSGGEPVSLDIQPVQSWGGLVSIFAPPETIQKGGTRTGRGSGRRSISILGGAQAGELDIDQDMGELKGWGYKPAQEPVVDLFSKQENELGLGIGLDMGIGQIQYQEQQQDLSTVSALNFFGIQSPVTFRIFDPTPITGYPTLFPIAPLTDQRGKRRKKIRQGKQRTLFDTHQMDKGLLSDLASVTRSHGRYGIATHPKLTKEIWDIGEKTMFMHVPTVELMKGKKKKKKTKKYLNITNRRMSDVLM